MIVPPPLEPDDPEELEELEPPDGAGALDELFELEPRRSPSRPRQGYVFSLVLLLNLGMRQSLGATGASVVNRL